jgi:hypothetical protein
MRDTVCWAVRKRHLQKLAGIAVLDEVADFGVGPGCLGREVQEGPDGMDCLGRSEGDPGSQAMPTSQNPGHAIGK